MADKSNPGEFGNRADTEEMAHEGGEASPSQFGRVDGADASEAGKKGAADEPHSAKVRGGEHSHENDQR